mgnify:CR=1 FL=1
MYILYLRRNDRWRELKRFGDKEEATEVAWGLRCRVRRKGKLLRERMVALGIPEEEVDEIRGKANQGLIQLYDEDTEKFIVSMFNTSLDNFVNNIYPKFKKRS